MGFFGRKYNPAVRNNYKRESRAKKGYNRPQVILESVTVNQGVKTYYHCHICIDGSRTDVLATYDAVERVVRLEPAHKRNKMKYFVSDLTPRAQDELREKIKFQLGNRNPETLRKPNFEFSYPFEIPISKEMEREYRNKKIRFENQRRAEIMRKDIVQKTIESNLPGILRMIGLRKQLEKKSETKTSLI